MEDVSNPPAQVKMGRPKIELDFEHIKKLCSLQCTAEEIAGFFDVCIDTLEARIKEKYDCTFPEFFKKHCASGKISLRRKQYEVAMSGNTALLIFLGKQNLGQSDKVEHSHREDPKSNLPDSLKDEE